MKFLIALADLNQPYSCSQWGNVPDGGASQIITDTGSDIWDLFNYNSGFPTGVWLDHEMRVHDKLGGYLWSTAIEEGIDQMLETCGCICTPDGCVRNVPSDYATIQSALNAVSEADTI